MRFKLLKASAIIAAQEDRPRERFLRLPWSGFEKRKRSGGRHGEPNRTERASLRRYLVELLGCCFVVSLCPGKVLLPLLK